jgi:hypothetical protein
VSTARAVGTLLDCRLVFSSTPVGDAHLVDIDADGWSRHLTRDEMLALRTKSGTPRFAVRVDADGTEVIARYGSRPIPALTERESERPTAGTGHLVPREAA